MDKTMLRSELIKLGIILVAAAVIVKIAFYKQDALTTTRTAFAWWWLFTLPGYFMLSYWKEKLGFAERAVAGTAAAAAFTAVASYYLGLLGLHVKYHAILLPLAMIALGILAARKKGKATSSASAWQKAAEAERQKRQQ